MTRLKRMILTLRLLRWAAVLLVGGGSAIAEPPREDCLGDPLPPSAVARLGTTRLRHDSAVVALAFAPDGKTLASVDWNGTLRIWETATGREVRYIRGRQDTIHALSYSPALAYSPNGKVLASTSDYGVFFWDPTTGAMLDHFYVSDEGAMSLAFAADGKTLAVGSGATILWWDVGTGVRLHSLAGDHNGVVSLAYTPDGKTLAYACLDEEIGLCDAATGKEIRKLRKAGKYPAPYRPSAAYSPDGKNLLVSDEHCWRLLDAATGKELRRDGDPPSLARPAYAPNGRSIAAMSWALEQRPWIWDLARNKGYECRSGNRVGDARVVVFSPDSKLLASGGTDGRVRLWDIAARKEVAYPAGDALGRGDNYFSLSRDGKILVALDGNGRMRLRDTSSGKLLHYWDEPADMYFSCSVLSPDGSQAVVFDDGEDWHSMRVVDAATGQRRWGWRSKDNGATRFAAYSPDGSLLAAPDKDGHPYLWDTTNGRRVGRIGGDVYGIVAAVFAPDGKTLVTAHWDHTLRLWDVEGKRERHRLKGHGGGATVGHIAFSADGSRLATGGNDGRICVWDARSGRRLHRWAIDEEDDVTCLALSSDGKWLVANAGQGRFRLWNVTTGKASRPIEGQRGQITFAAFLPDGRKLLTASEDGTALIWDVTALHSCKQKIVPLRTDANGDPLPPKVLARLGSSRLRHRQGIGCAAFSPDGKILAAASINEEMEGLRLWDAATGKELHRLPRGRNFHTRQLAFSPDGKKLAALANKGVQFWDVATGASLGTAVQNLFGIGCFAFALDGQTLAIAEEKVISLWSLDTGERLCVSGEMTKRADQMVFTADGKSLLTASGGNLVLGASDNTFPGLVEVWDIASGKRQRHFKIESTILTLAPKGVFFAYLSEDEHLHVCAGQTGKELWQSKNKDHCYLFSPDGEFLLTGDCGQPFHLRQAATGKEVLQSSQAEWFEGNWLCLTPDRRTLAVGGIDLWDVAGGRDRRLFAGHRRPITCLDFAPNGRTLVSASDDGTLRLWDAVAGKELRVIHASEERIKTVAFSRDGKTIASGDSRNVVRLWDAATGKELWRFEGPKLGEDSLYKGMRSVAFSPDGKTLIACGGDGTVYLWDAVLHQQRRQFRAFAHRGAVIDISPNGKYLAGASDDAGGNESGTGILRMWETATGRKKLEFHGDSFPQFDPAVFSPDGNLLAASRAAYRISFWELTTGKEMFHIDTLEFIAGFSPDGSYLITTQGTVWDMGTGKEVGHVPIDSPSVDAFAFSPDGRLRATGDTDGTILVQPMPRPARPKSLLPHEPSERELQALWTALSAIDPARAWPAMRTLVETPRQSVPFLRTVLWPYPPIDRRRLKPLLADLDDDRFAVREQARKELAGFGELAEPEMLRVLNDRPSLEVRRRVLALLENIERERKSPDSLRLLRATTILERIGTAESMALLRRLAGGAAEARVSREAAAALKRLTRRNRQP